MNTRLSHGYRFSDEEIDIADVEAGLNSGVSALTGPRHAPLPDDPGEFPISQVPLAAAYPESRRARHDAVHESYDARFPHDIYSSPSSTWERQRHPAAPSQAINNIHKGSTRDTTEQEARAINNGDHSGSWAHKFRGLVHTATYPDDHDHTDPEKLGRRMSQSEYSELSYTSTRRGLPRADSNYSCTTTGSEVYDPDDPKVTGVRSKRHIDPKELDKEDLRNMGYRARQKLRSRVRIEFNVSCTYPACPCFEFIDMTRIDSDGASSRISIETRESFDDLWGAIS